MESLEKTLKDVLVEKEDTSEERKKHINKLQKIIKILQEKNNSLVQNVSKMHSMEKNDNMDFSEVVNPNINNLNNPIYYHSNAF
jgi:hypothetical protein